MDAGEDTGPLGNGKNNRESRKGAVALRFRASVRITTSLTASTSDHWDTSDKLLQHNRDSP